MRQILILSTLLLVGCFASRPTADEIARADYGTFPDNYKDIVNIWIFDTFYDPHSVQDLVITKPEKDHRDNWIIDGGGTTYGYSLGVGLRAKNQLGGYTGFKSYYLLIRNGKVVFKMEIPHHQ